MKFGGFGRKREEEKWQWTLVEFLDRQFVPFSNSIELKIFGGRLK
jgi:hypothetical protein